MCREYFKFSRISDTTQKQNRIQNFDNKYSQQFWNKYRILIEIN